MLGSWNTHILIVGIRKGVATLENSLAVPQKFNCRVTMLLLLLLLSHFSHVRL